jgi:hypothetical protein
MKTWMQGNYIYVVWSVNSFLMFSDCPITQQCIQLESTDYFHIRSGWLGGLPRGATSMQGHESSLQNHQSPTGYLPLSQYKINRFFKNGTDCGYLSMPIYAGRTFRIYG